MDALPVRRCISRSARGEEDSNPLGTDCANALGSSGCAQCDYYACLEDEMQCSPDGYLADLSGSTASGSRV